MLRIIPNKGSPLPPPVSRSSAASRWNRLLSEEFNCDARVPDTPNSIQGFRVCAGLVVGCSCQMRIPVVLVTTEPAELYIGLRAVVEHLFNHRSVNAHRFVAVAQRAQK